MVFKKRICWQKRRNSKNLWNIYNNIESNCKVINFFGMTGMGQNDATK